MSENRYVLRINHWSGLIVVCPWLVERLHEQAIASAVKIGKRVAVKGPICWRNDWGHYEMGITGGYQWDVRGTVQKNCGGAPFSLLSLFLSSLFEEGLETMNWTPFGQ